MSTTKSFKFAGPFRSSTFNSAQSLLVGLNGVVAGMSVSTSGSVVTVQSGTFIQNGLMVSSDISLSATLPAGLVAPYSVAVTTSSSVENSLEVVTPTFVKRPQDVSGNTVIVADWDGAEWVSRPKIQLKEQILASQMRSIRQDFVGVTDGFDVTTVTGNTRVASGSLIDKQGLLFSKTAATTFVPTGVDADALDRVDDVVYRRPDDDSNRSGSLEYIVGQTFNPSSTVSVLHQTQIGNASKVNTTGKTLIVPSTNASLFFFIEDYGARATLRLRTSPDLMTSVAAAVTIATNLSGFDVVLNPDGSVDVVYTRGNNLFYQRVTIAGANLFPEVQIATHGVALSHPKIVSVTSGAGYFLHIVYEVATSGGNHQLFYLRKSAANTVETPATLLVSLSAVVTNPSLEKDDGDSLLLLAYENSTSGKVYLRQYDASTATALAPPTQLGVTLELEDDTFVLSSSTVLPASGSNRPIVKRADNKDTFVFWRQDKGGSTFGLAIYTQRYLSTQGHKAVVFDLTTVGENITAFDVDIDKTNAAHFLLSVGGNVIKSSLKLETVTALGVNGTLDAVVPTALSTKFNAKGSLVQSWSYPSTGFTTDGAPLTVQFIGPGTFPGGSQAIAANEFVVLQTDYSGLPTVPAVGDEVILASAGADNGTYNFTGSRTFVQTAITYVVVATSGTFVSLPSGPTAQFEIQTGTNLEIAKTTAGVSSNLRGFSTLHTDIFLAHRRSSDATLAVSGIVFEENASITRLYEFLNCFAGSGQISWDIVGANILANTSAIKFQFYNRTSLYQVAANPGGVAIANGQVAFVQIPDTDVPATLTLQVTSFGSGVLDRHGKTAFPLFWNIDGVLYMRFAPYRLSASGETIILGDQLSQQFISWVGSGTSVPDPTNHGYSSTAGAGLLQGDSHNVAIGKEDLAIANINSDINSFFGQLRITPHPTLTTRAIITGADTTLLNGSVRGEIIKKLLMNFAGARVEFGGVNAGKIYAPDDTTQIGTFTMPVLGANQFRWFAINLLANTVGADNRMSVQVNVQAAAADGASAVLAPRATFLTGTPIGELYVQESSGSVAAIANANIVQLGSGAGGSDVPATGASIFPADGYQWVETDTFDVGPTASDSKVLGSETTASYNAAQQIYKILCDKSRTVTTVGTGFTLSGVPVGFALAVGQIIFDNTSQSWRTVAAVSTTTTGTLDAAFSPNLTAAACMVSQAVWTQDLVNLGDAADKTRARDAFPSTTIASINVDYADSLVDGDNIPEFVDPARVVLSASNSGLQSTVGLPLSTTFAALFTRPQAPAQINNYSLLNNTDRERLFLVFFANPNNGSVTAFANLINYDASFYAETTLSNGGYLFSAFCMSDSTGTPNGCSNPTVVSGKTRVALNSSYVMGLNGTSPNGDLEVEVEGSEIPRFFTGVVGSYYKEIDPFTIEFWSDLSGLSFSLHFKRRQGSIDTADQNAAKLSGLNEARVGSAAQVSAGQANFSSLQAAHDAVTAPAKIFVLQATITENFTWSKSDVMIEGKGAGSILQGNLTVTGVRNAGNWLRVNGNINLSGGSNDSFFRLWMGTGGTFTPGGAGNDDVIIAL